MNDYAGLLPPAERQRLESLLAEREVAAGTQMAIALFRSLEGESLEDVANALFQKWRLGQKGLDNGVLLVVFVEDRKLRFEVGYGLEAVLPDAEAAQIIRNTIAPHFREQRYTAGLEAAILAVYGRIAPGGARSPAAGRGESEGRRRQAKGDAGQPYLVALLALFALIFGGLAFEASRHRGYTAARRGWGRSGPGVWYGGGWGGGGGGSSGGGGGFSGGGGSSGGGGASGSW